MKKQYVKPVTLGVEIEHEFMIDMSPGIGEPPTEIDVRENENNNNNGSFWGEFSW